jgi:hypothetical protein
MQQLATEVGSANRRLRREGRVGVSGRPPASSCDLANHRWCVIGESCIVPALEGQIHSPIGLFAYPGRGMEG